MNLYHFKDLDIRKIFILVICIIFSVNIICFNAIVIEKINNISFEESKEEKLEHTPLISAYTLVDPINISLAGDWEKYPFITGNGSETNPYIIENIEIQGNGVKTIELSGLHQLNFTDWGIYINAPGKFIIRNCKISSVSIGILLGFGVSMIYNHSINGVEIDNCGHGIYNYWPTFNLNISRCYISNCNWVTIEAPYDLESAHYGGFGICVRGDFGSVIEFCSIHNCSIGILAGFEVSLSNNQLFNCGFLFEFAHILEYAVMFNNTINGKPLGLFAVQPDLIMSGQEASQYGQLIFAGCENLHLSNIQITESSSIGLLIHYCWDSILQNIICENQKIGFFFQTSYMTADNLYAKNCDAGFCLIDFVRSNVTRLLTDNIDLPIYVYRAILDTTIGIEKSTPFCIIDYFNVGEIQINSSISSINVHQVNLSEFDRLGFIFQINDTDTYYVNDLDPIHEHINFIIIAFDRYQTLPIPGFPLFLLLIAILTGVLYLKFVFRFKKRRLKKFPKE
ncbi:MAG: hypothetical protein ACFFG0_48495 [Candidatus Thorarchaeota archaeon]